MTAHLTPISAARVSTALSNDRNAAQPASIKLVVIGAGRWGTHLVRNFLSLPQTDLLAVVDPNLEQLQSLPNRLGRHQKLDDRILLTDWAEALALPDVDAVVVATPAISHFPIIEAALQRGCHVLAEKPLTLDPQEARQLCQLAARQQRQLVVDHTYLFHPAVQQGQAAIRAGQLGKLRYGYANRTHLGPVRQDVDALWDLAVHDIAIFNAWTGESPIAVQAQEMSWLQPGIADLVWVSLSYPSGFQAMIHLCWGNPDKQRRLCTVGDRGTLVFDELNLESPLTFLPGSFKPACSSGVVPFLPIVHSPQSIAIEPVEPLQQVCGHFLDCVQHNTPSSISPGELGAELVAILTALTASLQQGGQKISLPEQI
jgi:predicted dehydrogenase